MTSIRECSFCGEKSCHGECNNYIIQMMKRNVSHEELEDLFKEIPKFNYILNGKISSIFGTEIEVAKDSERDEEKTFELKQMLYRKNKNGRTNFHEIKRAIREKEIFGKAYVFYDATDKEDSLYFLSSEQVSAYVIDDEDSIIQNIVYYTVGVPDIPDQIEFDETGFIKDDNGYIISPENMLVFQSDSYVLNSDLTQMQNLIDVNRKINETTTARDYGNIFLLTSGRGKGFMSATMDRIKTEANKAIKAMRTEIANLIKKDNTKDSNVIILDEEYKSVQQIQPLNKVTDYKFVWEKQDDIMSSVVSFPAILLNLGNPSGNISKSSLIKDARANFLAPLKNETANELSMLCDRLFEDEGYYLRFQDYDTVKL